MKRIQQSREGSYYHCSSETVHTLGWLDQEGKAVFVKILHKVAAFCGVTVVTYCVMDSHFHLLIKVPPRAAREAVTDKELMRRFRALYGDGRTRYMPMDADVLEGILKEDGTAAKQWRELLLGRMCDLPMFMKMLKQRFSKWYNATRGCRGTLWAQRFSSTLLEPNERVLTQVAAMIDTHALRMGAAKHPEDYPWCGFAAARAGDSAQEAALCGIVEPKRGPFADKILLGYEVLLYRLCGLEPKKTRRQLMKEILLGAEGMGGNNNVWPYNTMEARILNRVANLTAAMVYGSYVFVEAQAQWVAKLLKRKKPKGCYQLGEGEWTLNQRLGIKE
jgi:REP element-mobilizing transposase RayT